VTTHRLSPAAHERLRAELRDLTTRGRIEVAERIARARELGDLKENGDYHAAKDEQGHMEGRIRQLEAMLEDVEIVEPTADGVVGLGSVVTILYEGDDASSTECYLIGHIEERHETYEVMSPQSPLGAALLGAAKGQTVEYRSPNGTLRVTVVDTIVVG
jgi:transcription elongation factor GreA